MGRSRRRCATLLMLCLGVAACTGSDQTGDPPTPMASGSSPTPSRSTTELPWPAAPNAALPAERATKMAAEMQRWVDQGFLSGVTAAVVSPHGTWTNAVGVDGQGARLQPTSGMALGQVTQTFVAAEALLLAEQGKLDLDAPASTYLPIPQLANGATMRHLLGHRAAIPNPGNGPYAGLFTAPAEHWTPERFLAPVVKASAPPGGKFYFDTTNYVLAGLVVEKVAGRSIATAIDTDLWSPGRLERLAFQDEQILPEPIAAPGEDTNMPKGQTGRPYLPFRSIASAIAASQGVAGDAASVARWGYALYGGLILTPESVTQLTDFDHDPDPGFGLGTIDFTQPYWFQWSIDGHGMRGEVPGYRSVLAIYPEHQLSVAILGPSKVDVLPYVQHLVKAGLLLT